MEIEAQVQAALDALELAYEVWPCKPELADTAAFCAHYGVELADSANTIVVASKKPKGVFAACVVLATTRLDVNRAVKRAMGVSKVSFATGEQTVALTGMMIGGVTPPGLPETLPILVDAAVMTRERVVIGGGSRSTKIAVSPRLFDRMPNVRIIEGLAGVRPAQ